jgi:hypothetical protein
MENGQLLQDIWEKVSSIDSQVAVLGTKLDASIEDTEDHELRLRAVEKKVWWVAGAGAVGAWIMSRMWR